MYSAAEPGEDSAPRIGRERHTRWHAAGLDHQPDRCSTGGDVRLAVVPARVTSSTHPEEAVGVAVPAIDAVDVGSDVEIAYHRSGHALSAQSRPHADADLFARRPRRTGLPLRAIDPAISGLTQAE